MASRFRPYKTTVQVAEEVTTYGTAETSAQYNWVGYLQSVSEDKSRNLEGVKVIGSRNVRKQVDGKLESKVSIEVRENVANLLHYAFGSTVCQPTFLSTIDSGTPGDTTLAGAYTAKATTMTATASTNFTQHDILKVDDPTTNLLYHTRLTSSPSTTMTISPVIPVDLLITVTTVQEVDGTDMTAASAVGAVTLTVRTDATDKFSTDDEIIILDGPHSEVRTATTVAATALTVAACKWAHPSGTVIIVADDAATGNVMVATAIELLGENSIAVTASNATGVVATQYMNVCGLSASDYPHPRLIESVTDPADGPVIFSKAPAYDIAIGDFLLEHYAGSGTEIYNMDLYFVEADELPSCTIEVTREASTNSQSRFDGCVCNSAEFSIEAGGILTGTYEFITQFPVHGTSAPSTSASASADKARKPWTWDEMVVEYSTDDGATWTGFTDMQQVSIGINNNAEGEYFLGTTKDISEVCPGSRDYTFTMTILPAVAAIFYIEGAKSTTAQTEYAWRVTFNRSGVEYDSLQFVLKGGFLDPATLEASADAKITLDLTWNFQADNSINDEIGYCRVITQNPNLYIDEGLVS